jgi:glycosyltransferase involved in cell wall biosynthesis
LSGETSSAAVRFPFAVVIPAFDHSTRIAAVVEGARPLAVPIIVVDDGSSPEHAATLDALEGVTLLRHPRNRGKGAALLTGLAEAARHAPYAVTLDADGQHDPRDAPRLLAALPSDERVIVVGRRTGMDGPNTPWTSRFGRRFSNFWIRAGGGPPVSDSQSGFRIYPLPETLALGARSRRFQFEVEILVLARWKGVRVLEAEVAVRYEPPGERVSHFRPFVDFWRNAGTFSRLICARLLIPASVRARRAPPLMLPRG